MSQDRLKSENCNKTYCSSCLFHPNENSRIKLSQKRIDEIKIYLAKFESTHICHVTEKTCYGALEYQTNIVFHLMPGVMEENTVECFLKSVEQYL